ncbi:MAG TPA: hypothetical protein VHO48_14645 [Anaerolineaceae bacterium]|nr:hypothetical protein [Anaerolineaceae bacterium]
MIKILNDTLVGMPVALLCMGGFLVIITSKQRPGGIRRWIVTGVFLLVAAALAALMTGDVRLPLIDLSSIVVPVAEGLRLWVRLGIGLLSLFGFVLISTSIFLAGRYED